MDKALAHLRTTELKVNVEDTARLSPLGHAHINMLGRYYDEAIEANRTGRTADAVKFSTGIKIRWIFNEGMNIAGVTGLTEAQKAPLRVLGAKS